MEKKYLVIDRKLAKSCHSGPAMPDLRPESPSRTQEIPAQHNTGMTVEDVFVNHDLTWQMVIFCVERRKAWRILQSRAGIENQDYLDQKELLQKIDGGELTVAEFLNNHNSHSEESVEPNLQATTSCLIKTVGKSLVLFPTIFAYNFTGISSVQL